jgi:hypothetical protein
MADDKNPLDRANWTPKLRAEMEAMTSTQRAAVLMLLLGEDQAANIIKYLNPKEVQALGAAMVAAADLSQEAVNVVLDEFVEMLKNQTSLNAHLFALVGNQKCKNIFPNFYDKLPHSRDVDLQILQVSAIAPAPCAPGIL